MTVTYTEQERKNERKAANRKLRRQHPTCTCAVEVWMVNNGTDFARFEEDFQMDRFCPVHNPF